MLPEQDRAPAHRRSTHSCLAVRGREVFGFNLRDAVRSEVPKSPQYSPVGQTRRRQSSSSSATPGPDNRSECMRSGNGWGGEALGGSITSPHTHTFSKPPPKAPGKALSPENSPGAAGERELPRERNREHHATHSSPQSRTHHHPLTTLPAEPGPPAAPLDGGARPPAPPPAASAPPGGVGGGGGVSHAGAGTRASGYLRAERRNDVTAVEGVKKLRESN